MAVIGADLVAHVGEELALCGVGAVGLGASDVELGCFSASRWRSARPLVAAVLDLFEHDSSSRSAFFLAVMSWKEPTRRTTRPSSNTGDRASAPRFGFRPR